MQDQRFDEPVQIALGKSGSTTFRVERVAQAADILLNRWPAVTGTRHMAARKACLAALEGVKEARFARAAFINAAIEADILVERDPRS
ncbi:DUF982 domain-containing protein [Mesorhizobium sp. YC-39]|uniref:DUF982 domain-containing protein n=1 Tax=unclassified Mesorhizobium TaxID=325217 RepID=UPI0021E957F8|nr:MULTISPECIES: DUF982 domain-containing protein [unclassified Mesorhizobium]MCV3206136.1 DUF982 domain-containing protein [Mesorhizobium sp. YC-2]MCV3227464.1 DUF982 domain-containing protein [Mesorhizobium sp. YC-39]